MKLSQLIEHLQNIKKTEGDLSVLVAGELYFSLFNKHMMKVSNMNKDSMGGRHYTYSQGVKSNKFLTVLR